MSCLLCLKTSIDGGNFIPIQSSEWLQMNIQYIIEKHLWAINNLQQICGICTMCWYQLYDFHTFYTHVKNLHEQHFIVTFPEHTTYTNFIIDETPTQLKPKIEIKTCNDGDDGGGGVNDDENATFYTNDDVVEDINEEPLLSVMAINDGIPFDSVIFQRPKEKRRGRPRKCEQFLENTEILTQMPKRRIGRPRKNESVSIKPKGKQIGSKKIKRKRGRPRKYGNMLAPKPVKPPGIKRPIGRPSKISKLISIINADNNEQPVFNAAEDTIQNVTCKIEKPEEEEKKLIVSEALPLQFNDNSESKSKIEKYEYEKLKIQAAMERRKKNQQHKTLMRNYIATSVHCMEIFKN